MSGFRLFCFKQFFKVHIFCLAMMVVFRMFMGVSLGLMLWIALIVSTAASWCYLSTKPHQLTKDTYAVMAVASCFSLSIIAGRFLWIALSIDWGNLMFFLIAMVVLAVIVVGATRVAQSRKKRKRKRIRTQKNAITYLRLVSWGFFGFLFFYQLILSFLLRPNFLTVMALSISHFNLLLIIWTYFDIGRLYSSK